MARKIINAKTRRMMHHYENLLCTCMWLISYSKPVVDNIPSQLHQVFKLKLVKVCEQESVRVCCMKKKTKALKELFLYHHKLLFCLEKVL